MESSAPVPPRAKSRRLLLTALSIVTLAAGGTAAWYGFSHRAGSSESAAADTARDEARETLAAFLGASSAESRSAHVLSGETLLPLMQAWYAAHETEPLTVDAFRTPEWNFDAPSSDLIALECPRDRGRSPVVACFKKTAEGDWKLDWEIWTQSLDGEFRNFINKPREGEHTLRARLARNKTGGGMKVTVADPFDASQSMEFDITRKDLVALYSRDLPEVGFRTATVQLVWLNDALTGTLTPSLRRHVCWGYPGLDGREPEQLVINMTSKHRPPPGVAANPPEALAAGTKIDAAVKTALAPATTGALAAPRAPVTPVEDIETAQK